MGMKNPVNDWTETWESCYLDISFSPVVPHSLSLNALQLFGIYCVHVYMLGSVLSYHVVPGDRTQSQDWWQTLSLAESSHYFILSCLLLWNGVEQNIRPLVWWMST